MIIFTNVRKSDDYKVFILLNVHPAICFYIHIQTLQIHTGTVNLIDKYNWAHLQSSVFKLSKDLIDSIHEEGIVAYTS